MRRLEDLSLEELWQLFPIELVAYDDRWPERAHREIARLEQILGCRAKAIHHIGSTAIRGIKAKPIVDLLVEMSEGQELTVVKEVVIKAGYICMNETADRISFNRGYTIDGYADEVFHLHLRKSGDNDEIYFRDYLNGHPTVAAEYEALKQRLGNEYKYNRDAYTEGKTKFVSHYTGLAKHFALHD